MTDIISELDPEQKALIPIYMKKWERIVLSTKSIDYQKATEAIKLAYSMVGRKKPIIIFCTSPFTALSRIIEIQLSIQFGHRLQALTDIYFDPYFQAMFRVRGEMDKLNRKNDRDIWSLMEWHYKLLSKIQLLYRLKMKKKLKTIPEYDLNFYLDKYRKNSNIIPINCAGNYISGKVELWSGSIDYCVDVLNLYDRTKWQVIRSLIQECGWIFAFEEIAIVCDRPLKISFDINNHLYGERQYAIQFADGYGLFFIGY
ncbi:hypothetical protein IQ270_00095 [Microcoleus sp. LEGE 07076]|uniref:hypothetical protein n=1 Tax=Microcoleus sp. LEGE 07076 TaxID=915322 RepID=UPI00188154E9|nr:hypothetical protein [Microcoleus sp. LEGE 07076]MBE9183165.1 hypothetical protein [Microcoleus sp. LEGE 07076]